MNIVKNFELVMKNENGKVPMRSTKGSAGYDIFAPNEIYLPAKSEVTIELPFEFKGEGKENIQVRVFVRSSFGIKKKVRIVADGDKTVLGEKLNIEKDQLNLTLLNDGEEDLTIQKDEHFAQFIISEENPKEEKTVLEKVTNEELEKHNIPKHNVEVVRPNVYDYILEEDLTVPANAQIIVPSGLKGLILDGTWMAIAPHESVSDKVMLANQVAVVDKDYYGNESNDGLCFIALVNLTNEDLVLTKGTALTRWWSEKYYTLADEIKTDKTRTGGIGSTT